MNGDLPRLWRIPLLVLGIVSLFGATAAGLLRLGWNARCPPPHPYSITDR